jgi:hypothetical protein
VGRQTTRRRSPTPASAFSASPFTRPHITGDRPFLAAPIPLRKWKMTFGLSSRSTCAAATAKSRVITR